MYIIGNRTTCNNSCYLTVIIGNSYADFVEFGQACSDRYTDRHTPLSAGLVDNYNGINEVMIYKEFFDLQLATCIDYYSLCNDCD